MKTQKKENIQVVGLIKQMDTDQKIEWTVKKRANLTRGLCVCVCVCVIYIEDSCEMMSLIPVRMAIIIKSIINKYLRVGVHWKD